MPERRRRTIAAAANPPGGTRMLRRVVANFRRRDWAAAVVELAVAGIGVFIGLQASNALRAADALTGNAPQRLAREAP